MNSHLAITQLANDFSGDAAPCVSSHASDPRHATDDTGGGRGAEGGAANTLVHKGPGGARHAAATATTTCTAATEDAASTGTAARSPLVTMVAMTMASVFPAGAVGGMVRVCPAQGRPLR